MICCCFYSMKLKSRDYIVMSKFVWCLLKSAWAWGVFRLERLTRWIMAWWHCIDPLESSSQSHAFWLLLVSSPIASANRTKTQDAEVLRNGLSEVLHGFITCLSTPTLKSWWSSGEPWQLVTDICDEGDGLTLCEWCSWDYGCTHCCVTFMWDCGVSSAIL
jgi:hypothetical protein